MGRFFKKIMLLGIIASFVIVGNSLAAVGDKSDKFGLDTAADYAQVKSLATSQKSNPLEVAADYVALALSFLGVAFFILTLYAGFKWMTALGDSQKAEKAKEWLQAAVIGLIIVMAAYGISVFAFKSFAKFTNSSGGSPETTKIDCTEPKNNHKPCGVLGSQTSCYSGQCLTDCEGKTKEANIAAIGVTAKCKSQCEEGETTITNIACPTNQVCCRK